MEFLTLQWGKLACNILLQNWEAAVADIDSIKEYVEAKVSVPLAALQQRTWLMHWSLFVFFNHANGSAALEF